MLAEVCALSRNHARLDRKRWALARKECLRRANGRCACGQRAVEAHHVTRLADGGAPYDQANLDAVCERCHVHLTRRENRRLGPRAGDWLEFAKMLA